MRRLLQKKTQKIRKLYTFAFSCGQSVYSSFANEQAHYEHTHTHTQTSNYLCVCIDIQLELVSRNSLKNGNLSLKSTQISEKRTV